ncbi:MAG TPA: zinc ribbon domain-containing protein [Dehalococcoidia bacterium]|nr:zinc ribbon domain-containing protein [Dehalococcoidia bacterium]
MPFYEYRCRDCHATTTAFFRTIAAAQQGTRCDRCGSEATERLISRSFVVKGTGRFDDFDPDRALGGLEGSDPGSFARWARRMSEDLGESAGGERFRELAERAEAGDDPIERVDPGHTLRYELSQQRAALGGTDEAGDEASADDFFP